MPNRQKAVIFDMGGVILRTVDHAPREEMAKRFGVSSKELERLVFMSPTSIQSEIGELSEEEHWRAVLKYFKQTDISHEQAYTEFFSGDQIDQKMLNFAKSLKSDYRIGLLSNAWVNARKHLGEHFDFIDVFDVSIFSAEVGVRKPDEKIFWVMLERMQVKPSETIFVDDLKENIKGAEKIGIKTILYNNPKNTIQKIQNLLEN